MKKLLALTCTLAVMLAASAAHAQAIKIGTVDMEKIFRGYYKTKDAEARINQARSEAKRDLDDRMETYKETVDEINKLNDELNNGGLSDSKKADIQKTRDEKISEFKILDRNMEGFRTQKEKEIQDQIVRLRNDIVADIMKLIQAKIKSDNFDYVFDKSGMSVNGVPVVIFARDAVDFSDEIVTQLNKAKPKDTSTPAPSTSGTSDLLPGTPKPSGALEP